MSDRETGGGSDEEPLFDGDFGSFVPETAERPEEAIGVEPEPVPETPGSVAIPEPEQHRIFAGTGISWAFIVGVILTAAIIVLAVQNTDPVQVQLFLWETAAPLIIVMLITALVAILIDEMIGLVIRRRKRKVLGEREELKRLRAKADTKAPRIE
ncbi:MAG TPA: lipopolysaccharide assembly protein LapA domain-containing protein [Acidimicrobiia bacterium]|nr:lipopolysaccharide assembly protein LapA domain-containing protein [Acidimicrobiia bacterium]